MSFPKPISVFSTTLQHLDWHSGIVEILIEITHNTTYTVKLTYTCTESRPVSPIRVKYMCNIPCFPTVIFASLQMMKISSTTTLDDCIENIQQLLRAFKDDKIAIKSAIDDELQTELKKTQLQVQELLLQQSREIERLQTINRLLLEKIEQEKLVKSLNGILDSSLNEIFVS